MIAPPPLVALVGFKKSKLALGGGVRVLVVRDGSVRLHGKRGRLDLDCRIGEISARLTKTRTVELTHTGGVCYVYGFSDITSVAAELTEIVLREGPGAEVLGPVPSGALGVLSPRQVTGAAQVGAMLAEELHRRGARSG